MQKPSINVSYPQKEYVSAQQASQVEETKVMKPVRNANVIKIQRVQSSISSDSDCVPESYNEPEFDLSVGNYRQSPASANNNCNSMEETKQAVNNSG